MSRCFAVLEGDGCSAGGSNRKKLKGSKKILIFYQKIALYPPRLPSVGTFVDRAAPVLRVAFAGDVAAGYPLSKDRVVFVEFEVVAVGVVPSGELCTL
jgi:hypothetical protein